MFTNLLRKKSHNLGTSYGYSVLTAVARGSVVSALGNSNSSRTGPAGQGKDDHGQGEAGHTNLPSNMLGCVSLPRKLLRWMQ